MTTANTSTAPAFVPELGQAIFGNATQKFSLGELEDYASDRLYALSQALAERDPASQSHGALGGEFGYGQDFENNVFEMHPYWWGDCVCKGNSHDPDCKVILPNFRCGDLSINWYKYIGRGLSTNRPVTREELQTIFARCHQSISADIPT